MAEDDSAEVGARGTLVIRDKVVQRIAGYAAVNTPGVVRHSSGLDRVTGRDLPRVASTIAGGHVRATVELAVAWPQPLAQIAAAVRAAVIEQVGTQTGLQVDTVDVAVPSVLLEHPAETERSVH